MHRLIPALAVSLTLISITVTPAAAQNREHLQMAAELRMLQEQNQRLSLALAQLTDTLKSVSARLDATEQFQQRRFADQEVLVKNIGSDLSAIRERTQDTDTRMRSLKDEIDALRQTFLSLPALIAQANANAAPAAGAGDVSLLPPAAGGGAAAPPPVVSPAPIAPSLPLPPTAGLSPTRMYDTAFSDYGAGRYAAAITGFEQLVKTFPDAAVADDGQYLIGESLGYLNRLPDAIAAYNLVIQRYPKGDQVDMAYYRRGFIEGQMGRTDAARATFEELIKRYPDSQGASLARQRLVGMNRAPAAPTTKP